MTEITHPKLLALKEYMELSIDGFLFGFKHLIPERLINKYPENFKTPTFEDYYKNTYLVNPKHDLQVQNPIR